MQEFDIEITVQRALEKTPGVKPKLITHNGSQFISKDFSEYLRQVGLTHIKNSMLTHRLMVKLNASSVISTRNAR